MDYMQVQKKIAPSSIQLSQSTRQPIGTTAKEEIKADQKKSPEPVEFRSIFTPNSVRVKGKTAMQTRVKEVNPHDDASKNCST